MPYLVPRPSRWTGALAVLAIVTSGAASAQTYNAEQQRLCTSDAMRLCSSEIPNVEMVTLCMRKQKASLSEGCRAVFDKPMVSPISTRPRQSN